MFSTFIEAVGDHDVDYVRLFNQISMLQYGEQSFESQTQPKTEAKFVCRDDYFVNESVGGMISSIIIKSRIVKENNITFPTNMRMMPDQAFSLQCASNAVNFMVLSEPRNYYYYKGNETSITNTQRDISDDVIRMVNVAYNAFKATGSQKIMSDYFYKKFLPIKLDIYYTNRIKFRHNPTTETFNPGIKIPFWSLPTKTKIKSLLAGIYSQFQFGSHKDI